MRFLLILVAAVLAIGAFASWRASQSGAAASPAAARREAASGARVEVACAPRGGGIHAITSAIGQARARIDVLGPIAGGEHVVSELCAAVARGVQVELVVPPLADASSRVLARALIDAGARVEEDDEHAGLMGDVVVIDGITVVAAPSIADASEQDEVEVVLVVHDGPTAESCDEIWSVHAAHARPCGPVRSVHPDAATPSASAPSPAPAATPADDSLSPFSTSHRQH